MSSVPGTSVTSRRSLLAAAAAASAATVVAAVTRPLPAAAADHSAIVQGESAFGTLTTIVDGGNASPAFKGVSGSGIGAWGSSTSNAGVYGNSITGIGVDGVSQGSVGVFGLSGITGAGIPDETGVAGFSGTSANSRGVSGESPEGSGVYGSSANGTGVFGTSTNTYGVVGESHGTGGFGVVGNAWNIAGIGVSGYTDQASGVGGYFYTASPLLGTALWATGKVRFDQQAGVATVKKGAKTVSVTPGCKLTSSSAVTATLMGSAGGTITVHRVAVSSSTGRFTIYLTGTATANVRVAWHVFN
jgi:hypothetical protein